MPKVARLIAPNMPHHVIQRGNRRQDVFFEAADYRMYLALLREQAETGDFYIHAYCLMQNHVHLIVTPLHETGLRRIGEAHRRYTRYLNKKKGWRGYLWQGRFSSYPMDEAYAYEALRYVELNPVVVGICRHPAEYRWSSARQRIGKDSSGDFKVAALPSAQFAIDDWEHYWSEALSRRQMFEAFLSHDEVAMK
ncbi:MAG: transposase [Rickettsiales bacterium]